MSFTGPNALSAPTFLALEKRLNSYSPPIKLREHIVDNPTTIADLNVHPLTLQGVDFTVKDPDKLMRDIHAAKTGTDKAFKEGSTKPSDWKEHWALATSLLATKGIGFREPWRFYLNDRATQLANARPPRMLNAPEMDPAFGAYFGEANSLNMSALHMSIAYGKWTSCNIHIDETGIAMSDVANNLTITPNVISHLFNELILKTIILDEKAHLPAWFIDRLNLHILSPEMDYRRIGLSFDVLKGKTYKLTISASCGLTSCQDIDFKKIITLDGLKQLNPTVGFTKRF
jgi:hypothetical protein